MSNSSDILLNTLEQLLSAEFESLQTKSVRLDLKNIIPKAILALDKNMFVKGKFYEGDLLMTVLVIEEDFWKQNPNHWNALIEILKNQEEKIKDQQASFEMKGDWYAKIDKFRNVKM